MCNISILFSIFIAQFLNHIFKKFQIHLFHPPILKYDRFAILLSHANVHATKKKRRLIIKLEFMSREHSELAYFIFVFLIFNYD